MLVAVSFILVTLAINANFSLRNDIANDLILANVEALAQGESGGGVSCTSIYKNIESDGCLYYCCLGTDGKWYALYLIHCTAR